SFTTRFADAYDIEVQRWVDAVRGGDLVDGPNAWDGYLVSLACEAGVRALSGGVQEIETPERPAFYSPTPTGR
ncbi:MAG: inositol 2-dehydrogenase, partial [Microbacterium gubbeenense]